MAPSGEPASAADQASSPLAAAAGGAPVEAARAASPGYVVLLHGLGRTARSMAPLGARLAARGYEVVNPDYPSRAHPVAALVEQHLAPAITAACADRERPVHFVTHSLGAILVRSYLASAAEPNRLPTGSPLGRVVMLAPPNRGSEVVDRLRSVGFARWLLGPAFTELGTDPGSLPSTLARHGPVAYPVGVIAGTRTVNPLLSAMIPGPNDGKVSVERATLDGMADFLVVARTHTFLMIAPDVTEQVLHFLSHGRFLRPSDA